MNESPSDAEILCWLLGSAPRAEALLSRFRDLGSVLEADLAELEQVPGIAGAGAVRLRAVQLIAQRLEGRHVARVGDNIDDNRAAYPLFARLALEDQEVLAAAFLDVRNRLLGCREIFRGTLDSSVARPREILREALKANAAGIVIAHNHPSGDPQPSDEDARFTARLEWAAETIGIRLADHLVIGSNGQYFSFAQARLLGRRNGNLRNHEGGETGSAGTT